MDDFSTTRTIDELGRIVIPSEVRSNLNWVTGDKVIFSLNPDGTANLRLTAQKCVFCGGLKQR